jgi:hypothetical protein
MQIKQHFCTYMTSIECDLEDEIAISDDSSKKFYGSVTVNDINVNIKDCVAISLEVVIYHLIRQF